MTSTNLQKYICTRPWTYLDITDISAFVCCPSWLNEDILDGDNGTTLPINEAWLGDRVEKIRNSILDGSYRYCDHKVCPDLNAVISGKFKQETEYFKLRSAETMPSIPKLETVLYGQDRSCNLKCPSCRTSIIPNNNEKSKEHKIKQRIQNDIEEYFGDTIRKVIMTGSGDPIYSKLYRNFLINYDKNVYPSLKEIQLVSNGVLLDENMWNSFKCTDIINQIEISIDAGKKETYENVTRIGGDWDRMIKNITYLLNLTDVPRTMIFSFVVSSLNYKEMNIFVNLMNDISIGSIHDVTVSFRRIIHWESGVYSKDEIKSMSVFEPGHEKHDDFLQELYMIDKISNVSHNFHDIINDK